MLCFDYLHETLISTLVAGIAAPPGWKLGGGGAYDMVNFAIDVINSLKLWHKIQFSNDSVSTQTRLISNNNG